MADEKEIVVSIDQPRGARTHFGYSSARIEFSAARELVFLTLDFEDPVLPWLVWASYCMDYDLDSWRLDSRVLKLDETVWSFPWCRTGSLAKADPGRGSAYRPIYDQAVAVWMGPLGVRNHRYWTKKLLAAWERHYWNIEETDEEGTSP